MADKHPFCLCGCGMRTKGGTFRPGHDAKLRGKLCSGEKKGNSAQLAFMRKNHYKKCK